MSIRISPGNGKNRFFEKLTEMSGPDFRLCYQCGICSGSCPLAHQMDLKPREIMRRAQMGLTQALQTARSPWVCSTCDTCCVVCPRGIDIPQVMEALRLTRLRDGQSKLDAGDIPRETLKECPTIALVAAFRKLAG